jgi:hypothetical protein
MRILIIWALAAVFGVFVAAAPAWAQTPARSPFPVERGAAPPPPPPRASQQSAPPEGVAPGGIDFGQWRSADADAYAVSFKTQLAGREGGKDAASIQSDLQANGFACEQGARLDCRIEIGEGQCVADWYVVVDDAGVHPGYEKVCLGAR